MMKHFLAPLFLLANFLALHGSNIADLHPVSLKIIPGSIELKEGTTAELKTSVVFDDGSEQIAKDGVVYESADLCILAIDANATAKALKEGQTTVTSSYKGVTSEPVQALVYLEIGGHRLPPEPDPAINNSTLLGIDSNNNGVRDDVERYIYKRFQGFQNANIDRAIAMQYAKATQIIIQEPETAYEKKTYKVMHNAIDCEWYYIRQSGSTFNEIIEYQQKHDVYDAEMKDKHFNTRQRLEAYMKYNRSLSGHTYDSRQTVKEKCDFDAVWTKII